jgi:AAA15 family ATPase/GTPase
MLLEFKMKNFKSFRNLVEFKMTPAQKIKDLEYSLLKEKANNKEEKALSSSVIYGPNSSGKTNLIGGLQVFLYIHFLLRFQNIHLMLLYIFH